MFFAQGGRRIGLNCNQTALLALVFAGLNFGSALLCRDGFILGLGRIGLGRIGIGRTGLGGFGFGFGR